MIKTAIEQFSQVTIIQFWEGGVRDEDAKDLQVFFPR